MAADMLHLYQDASRIRLPHTSSTEKTIPIWELFSLLDGINRSMAGAYPYVQSSLSKRAVSVYVLYRSVAFTPEDFWDLFGLSMGRINKTWPICAFGTADNQETIRLTATTGDKDIQLIQQGISGKSTSIIRNLCLQIDCTDNQTAQQLVRLLMATSWETNIFALNSWQDVDFLKEQQLFICTDPQGLFCYGSINQEVSKRDMLLSLDFEQKIILWTAFLKDGFDPAEFEWISEEIENGELENRLEWEMALMEALDQLNFQMVNKEKSFEVFDSTGRRLYFGVDGRCAAEKVFLKILFPLNY